MQTTTTQALGLLRVVISLYMVAHGCMRVYAGTVDDFGGFLDSKGFPLGVILAWGITLFEITGGLTLALGYFRKWISAVFMVELTMGIILVHAKNGWFTVGHTLGGMEYSVLLIVCFWVTAGQDKN